MRFAFLIIFLVYGVAGFAGTGGNSIVTAFERAQVQAAVHNALLTNTLQLYYSGVDTQTVYFVSADAAIRLFNAAPVALLPGEHKKQLLKFSLPGNCLYNGYKTGVWCITASGDSSYACFTLSAAPQRDLQLYTTDPEPVVSNAAAQHLSLVVRNKGNTTEALRLHISGGNKVPVIHFTLPPYTDTIITAAVNLLQQKEYLPQVLTVALQDTAGQVISITDIHPRRVYSSLQLQPAPAIPAGNFASVLYAANNTGNSYREYQLSYNRNAMANGLVLAAYAFDGNGLSAPNISNSYIGYRQGNATLKAGLLNIWGELPVYGQGGNITLGDTRRYISASYLHNGNAYLNNETRGPDNETRNIHAAFGCDFSGGLYASGILLRQWHNPFYKDMYMGGLSLQWQAGNTNSLETAIFGNTGETALGQAQGAAARVRWTGKGKRWQLLSDNYVSSPGYAGILNNTRQLSENLTWRLSAKENAAGLALVANYMHSDPATYDTRLQRITNLQINEQYGVGLFKNLGALLLRVQPYYGRQQAQYSGSELYTLSNGYARFDAQYGYKAFSASLNMTAAFRRKQQGIDGNMLPVRMQGFFQYKYFTLQCLYQYRPFFATDLQQEAFSGKIFSLASISPGIRAGLFHDRLELYASYNLQYFSSNPLPMQYVFAGAAAKLSASWQLTAGYACTVNNLYAYQDIRLGVRFLFRRPADVFAQRKTMVFYSDDNHNGKKDAHEQAVQNVLIGAGPVLAGADVNGRIKLLHSKNEVSGLSLVNGNGYTGNVDHIRFSKKKAYVPLYRMGTVTGRMKLLQSRYSRQQVTIAGLPLVFTDEAGNKTTCYVQAGGDFSVSLPAGHYSISITQDLSDIYQLQQSPAVTVTGKDTEPLSLEVKYSRAQPVETIQFSGKK